MTARKPGPFLTNPTNNEPGVWTQNALATRVPDLVKGYASDKVAPGNVFDHLFPADFTSAAINAKVAELGGAPGAIHLRKGTWTIDSPVAVPRTVHLILEQGALLTKSGAGALTVAGPFEAPLSQVFSGFAAGDITILQGQYVTPRWWGALGDNSHDDAAAFQCAIDACGGALRDIWIGGGQFHIGTSLNCTSKSGLIFRGQGIESQIKGRCAGKSVFDCTGSNTFTFEKLWIEGVAGYEPQSAFLFARKADNSSAGMHVVREVTVQGGYTRAAVVSISSEVNRYNSCTLGNANPTRAVAITEQNDLAAVSDYETFPVTFSGGNTVHKFEGCSIVCSGTGAVGVQLKDIRDAAFTNCFLTTASGTAGMRLEGTCNALSFLGSTGEWQGSTHGLVVAAGSTLKNSKLDGVFLWDLYAEDTAVIQNTDMTGQFVGSPGVNAYDLFDCQIKNAELGLTVRHAAHGNSFPNAYLKATASLVLPALAEGNTYGSSSGRSDGQSLRIQSVGNEGATSRLFTKYLAADVIRRNQQVPATVAGGSYTPNPLNGTSFYIVLDASVTIQNPVPDVNFEAIANSKLWDGGATMTFVFVNSPSGGLTVSWGTKYDPVGWTMPPGANAVGSITFELVATTPSSKWVRSGSNLGTSYSQGYAAPGNVFGRVYPSALTSASIQAQIDAIGSDAGTIHFNPGVWSISSALSFPANIRVVIESGAVLTYATGGSLTFLGPVEAPDSQWLSGFTAGAVKFGANSISVRRPQWFGAKGDGVADDSGPVECVLNSSSDGGAIDVAPGRYRITGSIALPKYTGNSGAWGTALIRGHGRAALDDMIGASNYGTTFYVSSPAANTPIFNLASTRGATFERVNFVAVPVAPPAWASTTAYKPGQRVTADGKAWECRTGGTSGGSGPSGAIDSLFTGDGDCAWLGLPSGTAPVRGSVAIGSSNYASQAVFRECMFFGWEDAVRIGYAGQTDSGNNDFWTFDTCVWQSCTNAIRNYGAESYEVRANNCHFGAAIAYHTTGEPAYGTVMNSFKASECFYYTTTAAVLYEGNATAHSGRDIIRLTGGALEGHASCELIRVTPKSPINACGFVASGVTIATGDCAAIYHPAYRFVTYYGRGPFSIENCLIGGGGRIPLEFGTEGSGHQSSAIRIVNNVWTTARYAILGPCDDNLRPSILEERNVCFADPKTAAADPYKTADEMGMEPIVNGARLRTVRVPLEGETYLEGCEYVTESGTRRSVCRQRGTVRAAALSGVTATLTSGNDYATITAGTVAEIRKIHPGSVIGIGTAYYQEVNEVLKVGSDIIIYLKKAWIGATQTDGAVDINPPVWYTEWRSVNAAPTEYAMLGDIAWVATPGLAGPGGSQYLMHGWRCTASGAPATWMEMHIPTGT